MIEPAPVSLAAMLDAVRHAPDAARAAQALVALQQELLGSAAGRLVEVAAAGADGGLARRAAAARRPAIERRGDAVAIAVAIGTVEAVEFAAIHDLVRPTPLTLALAEERLTLTAALLGTPGDGWPAAAALAVAATDSLDAAAPAIAAAVDASRVIVARVERGVVGAVGDSAGGGAADHLARLRLAAGEAFDLGTLDAATRLPPGLAALVPAGRVTARTATAGGRQAVVIAVDCRRSDRLVDAARLVAATRPPRRALIPAAFVARVAGSLPYPANWPAERRAAATRRAIVALPLLLLLVPVPTSVDAAATIQPLRQRIVTAPFDGRIEAVMVQPGDAVRGAQTVLLRLDARTAESERAEIVASLQGALAQAEAAQVDGRSDDERLARLHAAQFAARAEGLALQIAAASIVAPIDGVVAGDDLRKRAGGPVSRGETLLTVAAPGDYRAEIRVPDRAIGSVEPGQRVAIALKARPLDRPRGTVDRLYPIAEVEDGDTIFRVIARLDAGTAGLLPGMEGRAAIRTGWAPLGWAVVRGPIRWVRLKLWI